MSSLNANGSAYANIAGPSGDLTLCGWFRVNAWTGNEYQIMIYIQPGSGSGDLGFEAHTTVDQILAYFWDGGDVEEMEYFPDETPTDWVYGAISISATTGKIRILRTGETTFTTYTFDLTNWGAGSRTIWVFNDPYAEQCEDVDGTRIRVFASELSDSDLLDEAQSDTPVLTPWASYPFTSLTNWGNDVSGNNRHLSSNGTPVLEADQPTDIGSGANEDELTPNDLTLAVSLDAPALGQVHSLSANDLSASVDLDAPAFGQVHVLSADDLSVLVTLDSPSLSTAGTHALDADDLSASVDLDSPALGQVHSLSVDDLSASVDLDSPALGQIHSLSANDLSVLIELDAPTLAGPLLKVFIVGSSVATGYIDNVPTYSEYALGRSLGLSYIRSDTETVNAAVEGVDNWWLAARYETDVLPYFDPTKRNIILHWELSNSSWAGGPVLPQGDPATIVGEIEDYADIAHGDGFEVLVGTSLPVDYEPEETQLNVIDGLLRDSTTFDGLIDFHTLSDFYPPGWPENPLYIDDVHLTDAGQTIVRDFVSTYLDEYINGTINNLSADDLSASVVLDSPALGQIHALSANDLSASVELDSPALSLVYALSANDLSSSVELDSPALNQVHSLSAVELSAVVALDSPALGQIHSLSANEINTSVALDSPALGQVHALSAQEFALSVELDSPSLRQVYALSANELAISIEMDSPGLGTEGVHALSADELNLAVALDAPALGQVHALSADDLNLATGLDSPALGQVHSLDVNALTLSTGLDSPALNIIHALGANDLVISVLLGSPELSTSTHVLVATDLILSAALASPALGQIHSLSADDLNISIWLDSAALGFGGTDRIFAVTYVHEPGQKLSYTWSRNQ